jgi:biopolymer transport protein ExbD
MRKARIEIIPMIDAIFFLLVFFMFSSLSMVKLKGVGVALPTDKARTQRGTGKSAEPAKLVVTLAGSGDFYIGKKRVSNTELQSALAADLAASPGAVVIMNPAKTQNTQALIDAIDTVRRVPTKNGDPLQVLIATEPVDANGNALQTPPKTGTTDKHG